MRVSGKTKIYRTDYEDGRVAYSRRIAWQKYENGQKGDWEGIWEEVKMPKGTDIPTKTMIDVKDAFESGWTKRDGTVVRQLVVLDFDLEDQGDSFEQIEEKLPF